MIAHCRRTLVSAAAFLVLAAAPALAQSGVIAGRVTDAQTGEPIASARVEVLAGMGRVIATAFTTTAGTYRIANLPPGTYALSISNVGYRDHVAGDIMVAADQSIAADAQLRPAAFELREVTVTVGRGRQEKITDAPASVAVVNQLAIEERPAVSLAEHVRNVQGVDIINAGLQSANVVVRGFNNIFSGSLHMLTDHRIASVPSLRVNFMHFAPQTNEDMQRMEIVLGPASALYGPNTASGVLHMITKSPFDEQQSSLTIAGGERDLVHVTGRTAHRISDTFGFKLSGQFLRADDWQYLDPVEEATRADLGDPLGRAIFKAGMARNADGTELTDAEKERRMDLIGVRDFGLQRWSADARFDWRPTPDLAAVVSGGRMMSNHGLELTGIGAGQVLDWAYDYYQARVNWQRVFAQAYLNTSSAGDTYLLRTGQPIVDRSRMFVSQLQHGLDFRDWQSFTYGVDYIRTMPQTEGTIHGSREADDTMEEWGAYIQSTSRLTRQFDLVLAGRVDDHSHLPDLVFSPRAALVFKPAEDQSFRFTFNRAFSTPSALNLFLDIDAGWPSPALGAMGYRVRAFAPGRDGIRFNNPAGGLFGMRSPYAGQQSLPGLNCPGQDPATLMNVQGGAGMYCLQINNFLRAAAAGGSPLPTDLANYLRSLQLDPALPQGMLAINPYTGDLFSPLEVQDVPGIRESITQSFEVGYKGVLGDRLLLAADVWFDRKDNFTSPLIVQSPLLLMHPQDLATFLVPRLVPVFMAAGMSQEMAQQQAVTLATQIVQVPAAVLGSPDLPATSSDLIVTYRNFGKVDLWGVDLAATAILTEHWQLGVTLSGVSDDHFIIPLDGVDQVVALNAPKRKATAALTYRNLASGLHGELRVRHNGRFPVNSAGYVGMEGCVNFDFGPGVRNEPCVDSFNIIDVGVGYRIPGLRGVSAQLYVQNLLDEDFRAFVGTPTIGRMTMLRMRYDF